MTARLKTVFLRAAAKIHTIHPGLALPVIGVGAVLATTAILVLTEPDKPRPVDPKTEPGKPGLVDQRITDTGPAPSGRGGAPPDTGVAVPPPVLGGADESGSSAMGSAGGSSGGSSSARRAPPATTGTVNRSAPRGTNTTLVSRPGEQSPKPGQQASKPGELYAPRGAAAPMPQPFVPYGRERAPMPQPSVPYRGEPPPMPQPFVPYGRAPAPMPVSAQAPDVRPEIAAGLIIGGLLGTILGVGHPTNGHPVNGRAFAQVGGHGAPVFGGGHGGGGPR